MLFPLLALMSASCSHRPEGVLPESKMVDVMTDLQVAEAFTQSQYAYQSGVPDGGALGRGVLAAHGVTREEYDSTLSWYGQNMDQYERLYAKVDRRIAERTKSLNRQSDEESKTLETSQIDLWPYGRHFMLSPLTLPEGLSFSTPTSDLQAGQQLEWKMRIASGDGMNAILGVEYDDNTTTYVSSTHSGGTGTLSLTCQTDTGRNIVRIFGAARPVSVGQSRVVRIDSVSLRTLPLDSNLYYRTRYQKHFRIR